MAQDQNEKIATYLYATLAASMALQMSFTTMLPGMIAMIIIVFIAYQQRRKNKDNYLASHFDWMIRTFWIGGGVYLPLLTLLGAIYLHQTLDLAPLQNAILSGSVQDPQQMMDMLMTQQGGLMTKIMLLTTIPFMGWWLWRCWKGFKALRIKTAVTNVKSWV